MTSTDTFVSSNGSVVAAAFGRTIIPKPGITHLGERSITFDDGTAEDVDVIVYCTGYKINFPFFDPGFLAAPSNDLRPSRACLNGRLSGTSYADLLSTFFKAQFSLTSQSDCGL